MSGALVLRSATGESNKSMEKEMTETIEDVTTENLLASREERIAETILKCEQYDKMLKEIGGMQQSIAKRVNDIHLTTYAGALLPDLSMVLDMLLEINTFLKPVEGEK